MPRPRKFQTGEDIRKAFEEYFQWASENAIVKKDFIRGGPAAGKIVDIPTMRPFSIQGFQRFHHLGKDYLDELSNSLNGKDDLESKDLLHAIDWGRNVIYAQQFEGACVGIFSAGLIARKLGLIDKKEQDVKLSVDKITGMEIL